MVELVLREDENRSDSPVIYEKDSAPRSRGTGTVLDLMWESMLKDYPDLKMKNMVIQKAKDIYRDCFACARWFNSGLSCRHNYERTRFYVHKSCMEQPLVIEREHPIPVSEGSDSRQGGQSCKLPLQLMSDDDAKSSCSFCGRYRMRSLIYSCSVCSWGIHLSCLLEDSTFISSTEWRIEPHIDVFSLGLTVLSLFPRHEHPLATIDHGVEICSICREIISSPFIGCEECSTISYHHKYAEMPLEIEHPSDPEGHRLRVTSHGELINALRCKNCGLEFKEVGYAYVCDLCCFGVHIRCTQVEVRSHITHSSSHHHPLTKVLRLLKTRCDACGYTHSREEDPVFYTCGVCSCYWIGETCGEELPSTVDFDPHEHPLSLAYSLPPRLLFKASSSLSCRICDGRVEPSCWCYWCANCSFVVHVRCTEESDLVHIRISRGEFHVKDRLFQLPLATSSVADILLKLPDFNRVIDDENTAKPNWSHEHPLYLFETDDSSSRNKARMEQIFCYACAQPISFPFYACAECNFFLHQSCLRLPFDLGYYCRYDGHTLILRSPTELDFFQKCTVCNMYSNGFFYECWVCHGSYIDIKCALSILLPEYVLHKDHPHHTICKVDCMKYGTCSLYSSAGDHVSWIVFECKLCEEFRICYKCAAMPRTVARKKDIHPLSLVTYSSEGREVDYCVICEEIVEAEMNVLHGFHPCDEYFHLRCIPEVNGYSRLRFGFTLGVGDRELHVHPLRFLSKSKVRSKSPVQRMWIRCSPHAIV